MKLPRTYWADRTVMAVLIATAAWLALTLARGPGEFAAIWIGNGLLTGWLLSRRTARWPGFIVTAFLAELAARLLTGDELLYAMAIAVCNLFEAVVVARIVRSQVSDVRDPGRWVDLGGIATAATLLACVLSGAMAATVTQKLNGGSFFRPFGGWFAAHVVGMVLVATTTLVALRERRRPFFKAGRFWSLVATTLLVVVVGVGVFVTNYPVLFLTYPPLLLAAIRHRFAGVAIGVIALALIGATATTLGYGPLRLLEDLDGAGRIALLQLYLAAGCLMTIPLCLAMAERDRLTARLAATRLELEHLSRVDTLTGLANRRQFDERLALALNRSQHQGAPLVLMYLDIDHFKAINDGHGHAAGDTVLQVFAARLRTCARDTDLVARLGGDEFVILLEDSSTEAAETVARRIIASMVAGIEAGSQQIAVGTSIGAAVADQLIDATSLMAEADSLLYAAKNAGRNRFCVARVVPARDS